MMRLHKNLYRSVYLEMVCFAFVTVVQALAIKNMILHKRVF